MPPAQVPLLRRPIARRGARPLVLGVALTIAWAASSVRAGDPPPSPPSPPMGLRPGHPTSPAPLPIAPEGPAFLAPARAPGTLGRLEDVAELAVARNRVAAVLADGGLRLGTCDALVAVAAPPGGDGWLHVAMPARGPAIATTRRGYVHRVAEDGATTLLGRIQRGALPAASPTGEDVVLATEGGAVYRVVAEGAGARLVEAWPSGAEPASAVACADGRVVVARTTGIVEVGPLAGPAARWLSLASPVTAVALGNGFTALGDARGRLWVVSNDAGAAGEPQTAPDAEVTALALLDPAPGPSDAPHRIVVLEGSRRLRLHRATRAGTVRPCGAPLALEPAARGMVAAGGDAVWLVGTDGRVRRVATAPPPASAPAAPTAPTIPDTPR